MDQIAFEENGDVIGMTHFDFEGVEKALGEFRPACDLSRLTRTQMEGLVKALQEVLQWVYQTKNKDGVAIRAIVICWILLPHVRTLRECEVARLFGLKKQSVGRWVVDFKRCFPRLSNGHLHYRNPVTRRATLALERL